MISYLRQLYENWQHAGAEGADPSNLALEKMGDKQRRRVHVEWKKEEKWSRLDLRQLNIFQLRKLRRRAARYDCPSIAANVEVIAEQRIGRGAIMRQALAGARADRAERHRLHQDRQTEQRPTGRPTP